MLSISIHSSSSESCFERIFISFDRTDVWFYNDNGIRSNKKIVLEKRWLSKFFLGI
jgi:hypothetical protein